jgi:hypothetical protein
MAFWLFGRSGAMVEEPVKGIHSSQDPERPPQTTATQPRLVSEFEVRERDVALRMRVERWPAPTDASDDDTLIEAGYGHGV